MATTGSSASGHADANESVASIGRRITDIRAPLWDHVTILDRGGSGGGNRHRKCKYCPLEKTSSYTRVNYSLIIL
uniref:Uncharacterized protein n=1 Tax=Arundo donax TaxID=35708 RepID=A0A0A9GY83_ARUDO